MELAEKLQIEAVPFGSGHQSPAGRIASGERHGQYGP